MREREYRWYLVGCDRLGQTPISEAEFSERWQAFEDHAETLKSADKRGTLLDVDVQARSDMQQRIKEDPFVKAVLVGMAEDETAG